MLLCTDTTSSSYKDQSSSRKDITISPLFTSLTGIVRPPGRVMSESGAKQPNLTTIASMIVVSSSIPN